MENREGGEETTWNRSKKGGSETLEPPGVFQIHRLQLDPVILLQNNEDEEE